jgi:TRAP-type C4-dicarboxylate transport system permease small subunit
MRTLGWINYRIYKFLKVFVVVIFAMLLLFSAVQVVLRLAFKTGIANAEILERYLVLWVAFLGATLATFKNRHINLDVISKLIRKYHPGIVNMAVSAASFCILCWLSYAGVIFILNEMPDSTKVFFIPVWIMEIIIPMTFILMALIFLQKALEAFVPRKKNGVK